jgi:hypothetical protein
MYALQILHISGFQVFNGWCCSSDGLPAFTLSYIVSRVCSISGLNHQIFLSLLLLLFVFNIHKCHCMYIMKDMSLKITGQKFNYRE